MFSFFFNICALGFPYPFPNAIHPQNAAFIQVACQDHQNLNDEERQYHNLMPRNTSNANPNDSSNHALDFSVTIQQSDENKKRKSIEPPDNPTHPKIANVTPTDASNGRYLISLC